jgi:hypothetical protein
MKVSLLTLENQPPPGFGVVTDYAGLLVECASSAIRCDGLPTKHAGPEIISFNSGPNAHIEPPELDLTGFVVD